MTRYIGQIRPILRRTPVVDQSAPFAIVTQAVSVTVSNRETIQQSAVGAREDVINVVFLSFRIADIAGEDGSVGFGIPLIAFHFITRETTIETPARRKDKRRISARTFRPVGSPGYPHLRAIARGVREGIRQRIVRRVPRAAVSTSSLISHEYYAVRLQDGDWWWRGCFAGSLMAVGPEPC